MILNGKRCHHLTKHIRKIGPPTDHYTSMHVQYNSLWNLKLYYQETAIPHNEYAIFLDLWSRNAKTFLIAWKAGHENIANYLMKHHSAKHRKYVGLIYLQINKTPRSVPIILLKQALQRGVWSSGFQDELIRQEVLNSLYSTTKEKLSQDTYHRQRDHIKTQNIKPYHSYLMLHYVMGYPFLSLIIRAYVLA